MKVKISHVLSISNNYTVVQGPAANIYIVLKYSKMKLSAILFLFQFIINLLFLKYLWRSRIKKKEKNVKQKVSENIHRANYSVNQLNQPSAQRVLFYHHSSVYRPRNILLSVTDKGVASVELYSHKCIL